ncbi:DUF615 domain-containing protein [Myxococcota bacterium]|nr:DUF615 domain-containing protein [Myxococcota bacterium]
MARKRSPFQWVADGVEGEVHVPQPRPDRNAARVEGAALEDLAVELSRLPPERRAALPLRPELAEAIDLLAQMSLDGARRRQIRHVSRMMRGDEGEELRAALAGEGPPDAFRLAAQGWLRRLRAEGDQGVQALLDAAPGLDRQQVRNLLRQARGEGAPAQRAARRLEELLTEARLV